jgi:hypothetical protein
MMGLLRNLGVAHWVCWIVGHRKCLLCRTLGLYRVHCLRCNMVLTKKAAA